MKKPVSNSIPLLFCLVAVIDIISIAASFPILVYIAKPLLMPVLMWWLFTATGLAGKDSRIVFAGLFFSFLGDTLLLFEDKNPLFFIFGLVFFLATHLCYIIYFMGVPSVAGSLLKKQPVYLPLVLLYGAGLIWLLYPGLGELRLPVIIYAMFICTMLLASLHIYFRVSNPSNMYYVAGAALFVLSDSLLAVNKFYEPFAFAGVLIMLTYCAAQFLVVKGFISKQ